MPVGIISYKLYRAEGISSARLPSFSLIYSYLQSGLERRQLGCAGPLSVRPHILNGFPDMAERRRAAVLARGNKDTQDGNRDPVVAEWDDTDEPNGREIRTREGETEGEGV